jgi:hypothetical protein
MAARQGSTDAKIADDLREGLPHLSDPILTLFKTCTRCRTETETLSHSSRRVRNVEQSEGTVTQRKQGKKDYDQEKVDAHQVGPVLLLCLISGCHSTR